MRVLLDSSLIIDFLRRQDKSSSWLYALSTTGYQLYASIITHTELHAGKSVWEKSEAREELMEIFSGIKLLRLTKDISEQAGQLRALYDTDLIDAIIAATAITQQLQLATLNQKHYTRIANLKLLSPKTLAN